MHVIIWSLNRLARCTEWRYDRNSSVTLLRPLSYRHGLFELRGRKRDDGIVYLEKGLAFVLGPAWAGIGFTGIGIGWLFARGSLGGIYHTWLAADTFFIAYTGFGVLWVAVAVLFLTWSRCLKVDGQQIVLLAKGLFNRARYQATLSECDVCCHAVYWCGKKKPRSWQEGYHAVMVHMPERSFALAVVENESAALEFVASLPRPVKDRFVGFGGLLRALKGIPY